LREARSLRPDTQTHRHLNQLSDSELVIMFHDATSRKKAFEHLVDSYQKPVYFFIRRMVLDHYDADDVTQNTFIKAWRGLDNFRGDSKLSTWLFRIATNEAITFINKRKKLMGISLDDVEHALPIALQSDVLYDGDEIQQKLQAAIATLPEKQKAVFILKYYEEKKYTEIAEITGTSVGALKASYHHAVNKIEKFITGH
jgi:RNA polymerase sigma factor (sigma-70 family)